MRQERSQMPANITRSMLLSHQCDKVAHSIIVAQPNII